MTPLGHHLTHLETSGLIRLAQAEPELEYIFRHALVQDAAYESMLFSDRRQLHHQAGKVLEQLYSDRLEELASILAHHFALAQDHTQALKYYTLAGDVAARSHANAEAIDHYTRAIEITRHNPHIANSNQLVHLYTRLGRACELDSAHDHALKIYAEMEQLAHDRQDQSLELAALMARATLHAMPIDKYDPSLVEALSQQALDLATELQDHEARAKIYWNKMLMYMLRNMEGMLSAGETSLAIARQHNLREREAYALHDLARAYYLQGQLEKSGEASTLARTLWRKLDNKAMLADNLNSASRIYLVAGKHEEYLAFAAEAFQISQSIGNLWNQSYSQMYVGVIYAERGQFSLAIDTMKACIDLGNQAGFLIPKIEIGSYLSYTYGILLGDLEQGFKWANAALEHCAIMPDGLLTGPLAMQAYFYLVQGDLQSAATLSQQSLDYFETNSFSIAVDIFAPIVAAKLALARKNYAQAIEHIDHPLNELRTWGIHMAITDLLHTKGEVLLAQGQLPQANAILAEARTEAERIGSKRILWQILATLAQLEDQRDNSAEAATLRQQARTILDHITQHIHQPNLQTSFLNQPNVRAILEATGS